MKKLITILALLCLAFVPSRAAEDEDSDSLGLPGDNLDLYGVLELFKNAESPEAFEKALNSESNHVNNLDLNEDGKVDYIQVFDRTEGDAHSIVLRIAIDAKESQDVATIEIEKKSDGNADLQIVGDEELYGEDYYIEPVDETQKGNDTEQKFASRNSMIYFNVWMWPCVRYIYGPGYVVWVSPWWWGYYPPWWTPWPPVFWHVHHHRCMHYHVHYHHVYVHRMAHAHRITHAHRVTSPRVHARHAAAHERYKANQKNTPRSPQGGKANPQQKGGGQQPHVNPGQKNTPKAGAPKGGRTGNAPKGNAPKGGRGGAPKGGAPKGGRGR
ncbi:MAG: hypothetical protein Fur0041_09030 [Bacteroidia bacterium]